MNAFITYDGLPLSSGGAHHLGTKPPDQIYASAISFLKSYTDSKRADKIVIQLLNFSFKNIAKYSLQLGLPLFDLNNFLANGIKNIHWHVSTKNPGRFIDNISNNNDLSIGILWRFKFVDIKNGEVLPEQAEIPVVDIRMHNSQIYLRLSSAKSTMSVWFAFPFENLQNENLEYIEGIQKTLPFKFSKQSWRLWKKSKNKNWSPNKISL